MYKEGKEDPLRRMIEDAARQPDLEDWKAQLNRESYEFIRAVRRLAERDLISTDKSKHPFEQDLIDGFLIKPQVEKLEKPEVFCRFFAENGQCVFNAAMGTDKVPSLANVKYDFNECGARAQWTDQAVADAQSHCDQFVKGIQDTSTRNILPK